jgi:hypothetical protein
MRNKTGATTNRMATMSRLTIILILLFAVLLHAEAQLISLTYIAGSAVKMEQLIGDYDKSAKQPTRNQTMKRFSLEGTDLGYPFEHNGKIIFLFGDSIGSKGGDAIGYSTTKDPEQGLLIDMYKGNDGRYIKVAPPGVSMKGFEVPVCGISVNGTPYVWVKTGRDSGSEHSLLTKFDESKLSFNVIREFSRRPGGKFIEMTAHHYKGTIPGIQGDSFILIMGASEYRKSSAYLCVISENDFESGKGTRYFAGRDAAGDPRWSLEEKDAVPVFDHPTIGNLSLTWCDSIKRWLCVYDSRDPKGILLRYASSPWKTWSAAEEIFNIRRDNGYGKFVHEVRASKSDGLAGPVIGQNKNAVESVWGGEYAPFVIERFTKTEGNTLTLYFLLSTWNPYTIVLMRTKLLISIK